MRKRSKYRPRPVIADTMHYVRAGFRPLTDVVDQDRHLRTRNHLALEAVMRGQATRDDIETLIAASNMTMALKRGGFGDEYHDIARAGADAIEALRGRERHVCTGPELTAIKRMMELHDAQLDIVRIIDLEAGIELAKRKEREAA